MITVDRGKDFGDHGGRGLAIGDPTIGWVNAAFRLMQSFAQPEFPRRILTPALVFAAGDDRVVDSATVERFAHRLKAGHLVVLPQARHEILMERDPLRAEWWAATDAFLKKHAPAVSR